MKRFLVGILLSALCFIYSPVYFANNLPNLGDPSESALSPQKEKQLGKYFMRSITSQLPLEHDPIINDYIQQLGYRLVTYSAEPSRLFHFFVIKDASINAITGPDAYIGVNTGLILTTQSESELASVLAHEIAHVTQGHVSRFYAEQKQLQLPALCAMIAAIAIGTRNPEAGMGAMSATTAGLYQHTLNFSRGFEQEADRVGMQILARAKFDQRSMPLFFEHLEQIGRLNSYNIPEFLQTHPLNESRLADAYNRSERYPHYKIKNSDDFQLIQAKIMASTTDNAPQLIEQFHAQMSKNPRDLKFHYAYILALLKANKNNQAKQQMRNLLKRDPNNLILNLTYAKILQTARDTSEAEKILAYLYQHNPDYYPVISQYADFLISHHHAKKASIILKKCYDSEKSNDDYLLLYSKALGESKQLTKAYQIRAEIYERYDNISGAIAQLKMALRYTKNNAFEQQIIQGKIDQLEVTIHRKT